VDTNNSVFNSNFAPSASQLDTNEVDPVAEADVYIAYGRDAQAEEILKEALRTHPERHAVRLKLLEIYVTRKDARAFETRPPNCTR
jgi:pilus assembly protein FimV